MSSPITATSFLAEISFDGEYVTIRRSWFHGSGSTVPPLTRIPIGSVRGVEIGEPSTLTRVLMFVLSFGVIRRPRSWIRFVLESDCECVSNTKARVYPAMLIMDCPRAALFVPYNRKKVVELANAVTAAIGGSDVHRVGFGERLWSAGDFLVGLHEDGYQHYE